jgi:ORF6N domain-containing protein
VPKKSIARKVPELETLIYEIRGQRVMLDSDLAQIYGVETKSLNTAVKRNRDRFPRDFLFLSTNGET